MVVREKGICRMESIMCKNGIYPTDVQDQPRTGYVAYREFDFKLHSHLGEELDHASHRHHHRP